MRCFEVRFLDTAKWMFRDPETHRFSVRRTADLAWSVFIILACGSGILFFFLPRLVSIVGTAVQEGDGATLVTGAVTFMIIALLFLFKFSPRTKKDSSK